MWLAAGGREGRRGETAAAVGGAAWRRPPVTGGAVVSARGWGSTYVWGSALLPEVSLAEGRCGRATGRIVD